MDIAYNQHSSHARRKNRSSTNLNHLTLAPLTTKLPLEDSDEYAEALTAPPAPSTSYLQGKSVPTTPRLLSRSPARSRSHTRHGPATAAGSLPKSKSTTHLHLHGSSRHKTSGAASPAARRPPPSGGGLSAKDRNDSDWLLRAGAMLTGECREYKGQAWLVSRASSTSLAAPAGTTTLDQEEAAFERGLAREREHHAPWTSSRHQSRRGSTVALGLGEDDLLSQATSPQGSRFGSRTHSMVGSRSQLMTPKDERRRSLDGGYFGGHGNAESPDIAGPDFVNLDEKLEAIDLDTSIEDEAHVRRLVKREQVGSGGFWLGSLLGWSLFSVEEDDAESDDDDDEDGESYDTGDLGADSAAGEVPGEAALDRKRSGRRQFEGITSIPEERVSPPKPDEGGWHDAAWLLSVASKVLL